jgi:hypothetical protein
MGAMNLYDVPPVDVRPLLIDERTDLLRFMQSLAPGEWAVSSAAPGWTVKDLALHLLDDDLGWLSRGRDGDRTGLLSVSDHGAFVEALAAKNQRWIDGARGLSGPVIIGLLEWAGREMDAYYATMDLTADGHVGWASNGRVPMGGGCGYLPGGEQVGEDQRDGCDQEQRPERDGWNVLERG